LLDNFTGGIINMLVFLFLSLIQPVFAMETPSSAKAFQLQANYVNSNTVNLHFTIKPGNHLFKDHFSFSSTDSESVKINHTYLPKGQPIHDDIFGDYQVYQKEVTIPVQITHAKNAYTFSITYQGCEDHGVCFPPTKRYISIDDHAQTATILTHIQTTTPQDDTNSSQKYNNLLENHPLLALLVFFGMGILLSFTPCVLPMIPILSSIIVGQANTAKDSRAITLSIVYVLSMSLSYALAGGVISLLGNNLQAQLQSPWVLSSFALLFAILACSLFGFYEIQLPASIRAKATVLSNTQKQGSLIGTAMMGSLSILILSPCVTPPLIGTLIYIAKTGNIIVGCLALFCMGLGMGMPLIALGVVGNKMLLKAGSWMNTVKHLFGFVLLGVALWLIMRIVPAMPMMILWGIYAISMGGFLLLSHEFSHFAFKHTLNIASASLCIYGAIILTGAALGHTNPLAPLHSRPTNLWSDHQIRTFKPNNITELTTILEKAKSQHVPVMLDYSANWCITCKENEHTILQSERITHLLTHFWIVQVDVTQDTSVTRTMKSLTQVVAPPALVFYNQAGTKLTSKTIDGPVQESQFYRAISTL
jgi:thiol:disulfide interchange protein DsbD